MPPTGFLEATLGRAIPSRRAVARVFSARRARRPENAANAGNETALQFPSRQSSESHAEDTTLYVIRQSGQMAPSLESRGRLFPRDKIRQQLEVLRDLGLLDFLGGGPYCLVLTHPT